MQPDGQSTPYVFWSPAEARLMAQGQPPSAAPPARPSAPTGPRPLPEPSKALVAAHWAVPGAGDTLTPEQLHTLLTETGIYVAQGDTQKASAQRLRILRLCTQRGMIWSRYPAASRPVLFQSVPHVPATYVQHGGGRTLTPTGAHAVLRPTAFVNDLKACTSAPARGVAPARPNPRRAREQPTAIPSTCRPGLQRPQQPGPAQQLVDASGQRHVLRVGSGE
jgi:hypothetical protein